MEENFATWGIVELMGHKVVAGKVSKAEEWGAPLLRVDVPATTIYPEFTQLYGNSAIYCVTFVSEEVARRTAEANKTNPVSVYVPDLVTREQLAETVKNYEDRLTRLRALPDRTHGDGDEDMEPDEPEDW